MPTTPTILNSQVHGSAIETGKPDDQVIAAETASGHPMTKDLGTNGGADSSPWWLDHLTVNPTIRLGKFVVKGTAFEADYLVEWVEKGSTDEEILRKHSGLLPLDIAAVREFASLPLAMRRSFGAWADDTPELDEYLERNRGQRKCVRGGLDD